MKSVSVSKAAVLDICNSAIDLWTGQLGEGALIAVRNAVMALPPADAVPRGAYDQVRWERDIALGQLKRLGYGLGEKVDAVPVVRCRNCRFSQRINEWVYECYVWNDDRMFNQYCDMGERKDGDHETD